MPEADTETQRALYPVALVPLSKGAQLYQTGFVPTLLSSRLHWTLCSVEETIQPHCLLLSSRLHWTLCSVEETIQPHCLPDFHWTLWESTQRLKVLWDTGVSFLDMEVGIHGLNFWRPRKWQLPPGFCQMEDRQCAWRRALREAEVSRGSLELPEARGRGWGWDQSNSLWARGLSVERDTNYPLSQWLRLGPAAWEWVTAPAA